MCVPVCSPEGRASLDEWTGWALGAKATGVPSLRRGGRPAAGNEGHGQDVLVREEDEAPRDCLRLAFPCSPTAKGARCFSAVLLPFPTNSTLNWAAFPNLRFGFILNVLSFGKQPPPPSQALPRDRPPQGNMRAAGSGSRGGQAPREGEPWAAPAADRSPLTPLPGECGDHLNRA